jgi:hypothetical protein
MHAEITRSILIKICLIFVGTAGDEHIPCICANFDSLQNLRDLGKTVDEIGLNVVPFELLDNACR